MNNEKTSFKQKEGKFEILTSWCEDTNKNDGCPSGNLFLKKEDGTCTSLASGVDNDWTRSVSKAVVTDKKLTMSLLAVDSAVIYTKNVTDHPELLGLQKITIKFVCKSSFAKSKDIVSIKSTKVVDEGMNLEFIYEGSEACGYETIDPITLMKQNTIFPIIFLILSLSIFIYSRRDAKMALGISGGQSGMLMTVFIVADLEEQFHLDHSKLIILLISCLIGALIVAIFSIYSYESAVFLQAINSGIASSMAIAWIYCIITGFGIKQIYLWIGVGSFSLLFILLCLNKKFLYTHSLLFFTNYTQPFYFFASLATILGVFPEFFKLYELSLVGEKGSLSNSNWYYIGGFIAVTTIGILEGGRIEKSLTKKTSDQESEEDNDLKHRLSMFQSFEDKDYADYEDADDRDRTETFNV